MSKKLSIGQSPLSYLGVRPTGPAQTVLKNRAPLTTDIGGFYIGDEWIVKNISQIFKLTRKSGGVATWTEVVTAGGGDDIESLIGDDGNHATPDAAGDVTIAGGTNITTDGSVPNTLTVKLDDTITLTTVNATTFDTNVAAAAVTLSGTSLVADGTDANIDINITAKGTGNVIIDDLQLSVDLDVPSGGTGASVFTLNGLLYGGGVGAISALVEASDGQIPIGSTGNPAVLATIIGGSSISVTNGAGSVTINNQLSINEQTGVAYTLVLGDAGKMINCDNAAAITLTIPLNASVAFPIGTEILIAQKGVGRVTVTPAGGVTLDSANAYYDTDTQYSLIALIKTAMDQWYLGGDLS